MLFFIHVLHSLQLNRALFEGLDDSLRVEIEGFRSGLYVRMEIANMPCEFVNNFDPTYPIIVGSVQPGEQNIGYVKVSVCSCLSRMIPWCFRYPKWFYFKCSNFSGPY